MTLQEEMIRFREHDLLSQTQASKLANVSLQTWNQIELGNHKPSMVTEAKIRKVMGKKEQGKGIKTSISRLKLFKACRRAYYFRYVEGLEPVEKSEALEIGTTYHEMLEDLYKSNITADDHSKESAMVTAYKKYIYPQFNVKAVEEWASGIVGRHILLGRVDGIAEDGALVEHKTTSLNLDEYEYNLQWDEQMLVYMWLTDTTHIWYTIIRKPTIRQKKDETDEEFYNRIVEWYDDDTESKIRVLKLERTKEQISDCMKEMGYTMDDINNLADAPMEKYSKNTCYCNHWGRRCEYSSICLDYDPNREYVEFVKGEETYGITENQ